MEDKDLHYLVTRVINPELNWVLVIMRSGNKKSRVVYGRDGYSDVTWRNKTIMEELADLLEEWRDNLWYEFQKEFPQNSIELVDSFMRVLYKVELDLYSYERRDDVLGALWTLAENIGAYLELREYVLLKRDEIKAKVEERMRLQKEQKSLKPHMMVSPSSSVGNEQVEAVSEESDFKTPAKSRGLKARLKRFFGK